MPRTLANSVYMPYWNYYAMAPKYGNRIPFNYNEYYELKDKQNLKFQKFIHTQTEGISDTSNYLKLTKINQEITNNFEFQADSERYKGNDSQLERIGEFTENKILREVDRYILYQKVFYYLKLLYVRIYLIDNRVGEMNDKYIPSLFQNKYVFGIINNDIFIYLYPKKSIFGYYLEELPFYWENTQGLMFSSLNMALIPQEIKPVFIAMPSSNANDNKRRSSTIVNVDINKLSVDFTTNLFLSGQFSTMTRGVYLYNHKNEMINNLYNKKIYDDIPEVKLINKEISNIKTNFPYNANFKLSYSSLKLLKSNNDSIYSLNLNNWFKFIIYKNMNIDNRQLDFYPDFLCQDTYTYLIKFNKNIELIKHPEKIEINNNLGRFIINIEQPQPNIIKLSSYLAILHDSVKVADVKDVEDIYNQIQKLNSSYLIFKLK